MIIRCAHGTALVAVLLAASPAAAQTAIPIGVSSCSGCHAPAGTTAIPALRGLPIADFVASMLAFRTGTRPATVMDRIAKGFGEDEIQAMAAWFAGQR